MNRREFVLRTGSVAVMAGALGPSAVYADVTNLRGSGTTALKRAYVDRPRRILQDCPEWCWATSASMLFAYLGRPTDQKTIIEKLFPGKSCSNEPTNPAVISGLNAEWTAVTGKTFTPKITTLYEKGNAGAKFDPAVIVAALSKNHPLLYANGHHAMVISAADYIDAASGPDVQIVYVVDPLRTAEGYHPLSAQEIVPIDAGGQMAYLATIELA